MNGKLLWNGVEVNIGEIKRADDFVIPEERIKDNFVPRKCEGSLTFKMPLNPLWKRQQETGVPKRVHLSYLCNFN